MWFVPASERHTAAEQRRAGLVADYVMTAAAPGLQASVTTAIRHTPGVVAVTAVVASTLLAPQGGRVTGYTTQGVDAATLSRTLHLGVTSGSIAGLHGSTVAIDTQTARALHLRRAQVLRMACLEQALLLGLALVIGAAITAATLVPTVRAVTGSATPHIPVTGWVALIGGTVLLGAAAMILPARWVLRMPPAEAIGTRE